MLKLLILALVFWMQAEQDRSKETTVSHAQIIYILDEASRIEVPNASHTRDSKDTGSIQPAPPPPPPNLPEPPAF